MAPAQPHDRVFNFSAGPGALPVPVLEEAARDALNYKGCGISVMELSHRSKEFTKIIEDAEADLRKLLEIPDNYRVLFLQGGASAQFAAIPLNLTASKETVVDYLVTGSWSKKAAEEAGKYATVNVVAKGDNKSIPDAGTWKVSPEAAYLHYCDNETIQGVEFLGEEISIRLLLLFFSSSSSSSFPPPERVEAPRPTEEKRRGKPSHPRILLCPTPHQFPHLK
jgi:phosphoserine aminotransferase